MFENSVVKKNKHKGLKRATSDVNDKFRI